jgi:hypothetical protein
MPTSSGAASLTTAPETTCHPLRPGASGDVEPLTLQVWPAGRHGPTTASEGTADRGATDERQRRAQDALEAQRTAARRAAREHLPSPAEVAKEIAMALFGIEAGRRSATQLERVCSPELWELLEHQVQRHGGPLPRSGDLLRVHYQELVPGLANTVAVVQRGPRVQPVAMRLDACSGRWLVTELRY